MHSDRCYVCRGKLHNPYFKDKSFRECKRCGLGQYLAHPTSEELKTFYDAQYGQYTYSEEFQVKFEKGDFHNSARHFIGKLKSYSTEVETILDFGSGKPYLAKAIESLGVQCFACDLSFEKEDQESIFHSRFYGHLEEVPVDLFDAIHASHVLEHLMDPRRIISEFYERLRDGGILYLAVPNWNSIDARRDREDWVWYHYPSHLWQFTMQSLSLILETSGFAIIESTPRGDTNHGVVYFGDQEDQIKIFARKI